VGDLGVTKNRIRKFLSSEKGDLLKIKTQIPAGTKVKMENCPEAETYTGRVWITRSKPWKLACGEWLVSLEDFCGGFALKYLRVVSGDIETGKEFFS